MHVVHYGAMPAVLQCDAFAQSSVVARPLQLSIMLHTGLCDAAQTLKPKTHSKKTTTTNTNKRLLIHPSRWSAATLAGCTTVSNCATIEHVEGLLCVM